MAQAKVSDGLKRLWRAVRQLPLLTLALVIYFPSWVTYELSSDDAIGMPWWVVVVTAVFWLVVLVDLCTRLLRSSTTVKPHAVITYEGRRFVITRVSCETDGHLTVEALGVPEYRSQYMVRGRGR